MIVRQTEVFRKWADALGDVRARERIEIRLDRLANGNPGMTRSVGGGIFELKVDYGPGYRVYFIRHGEEFVVLLCGGDKSTQSRDIQRAKKLAEAWKEADHDA